MRVLVARPLQVRQIVPSWPPSSSIHAALHALPISFPKEAYEYGRRSSGETHGVVLTKPHMVELILDLAATRRSAIWLGLRLLEPACGHGAFLVPAIGRLMTAAKAARVKPDKLADCVRAFDIDEEHVAIHPAAAVV